MSIDSSTGHPEMDYPQAEKTYKSFIFLTKLSIASMVVLLAGMAFFLT